MMTLKFHHARNLLCLAVLSCAMSGCAHLDATGELVYAQDAKKNYELGQKALQDGRYQDAQNYFEHVRNKFPYSSQAALADLAIADTSFEKEKYLEAIESYKNFLNLHPSHVQAHYASFRIGLSYYKDIPSDFFLFPPSSERDQTSIRDARVALDDFLKQHPNSSFVPEGKRLWADVLRRLAKHELYVADFYLHRQRWQSAIGRLNRLLLEYPGLGLDSEVLFKLGDAYLKEGQREKARETWERLVRDFPKGPYGRDAAAMLKNNT